MLWWGSRGGRVAIPEFRTKQKEGKKKNFSKEQRILESAVHARGGGS